MKNIAYRLREGRFNSLEDLILEAADASPNEDTRQVFSLLAKRLPKAEIEVKSEPQELIEDIGQDRHDEGYDDGKEKGYDAGWNDCLEKINFNLPEPR